MVMQTCNLCMETETEGSQVQPGAGKAAQWAEALTTRLEGLSSVSGTYIVEEDLLPQAVF